MIKKKPKTIIGKDFSDMTIKRIKLCELSVGECAEVRVLLSRGAMRRRLQDLGIVEDTSVECIGKSPGGGMGAYLIRGAFQSRSQTNTPT